MDQLSFDLEAWDYLAFVAFFVGLSVVGYWAGKKQLAGVLGVRAFREHVAPLYGKIFEILSPSGKRLLVHYDGKLRVIAGDIAKLPLDIDSFTPPPEGDMTAAEARAAWPDKFLWLHPPLGWYREARPLLIEQIRRMASDAGPSRYCLMISEDIPPDWQRTVPAVLAAPAEPRV